MKTNAKTSLSSHITQHIKKAQQTCLKRGSSKNIQSIQKVQREELVPLDSNDVILNLGQSMIDNPQQAECDQFQSLGLECTLKIKNCQDMIHNLLETGAFVPEFGMSEQQKIEHKALFTNIDSLDNNRNVGTMVGMTTLGFVGFVGLGFNVFGALGGICVGAVLGRYAGNKISKKMFKTSGKLREFDIFIVRLSCVIKWSETQMIKYRYNYNVWRFSIERLMLELKPMLHYKYFDSSMQNKSIKMLKRARLFLIQPECLNAIYLTYKLTKAYLNILERCKIYSNFAKSDFEFILVHTIQNVLRPLETLFATEPASVFLKYPNLAQLCQKIKNLYLKTIVIRLLTKYPDGQLTVEYIKVFSNKMKQIAKFDIIEQFLQMQTYKDIEALGLPLNQNDNAQAEQKAEIQKNPFFQSPSLSVFKRTSKKAHSSIVSQVNNQSLEQIFTCPFSNNEQSDQLQKCEVRCSRSNSLNLRPKKPINNQFIQLQGDNENLERESVLLLMLQEDDQLKIQLTPEKSIIQDKILSQCAPSPMVNVKHDTLSDELENKFKMMIDIVNEPIDSWDVVLKKENILIYKTFKFGNNAVFIKGYGDIPGVDKEIVFQCIYDQRLRTQWDKMLENFHVIEKESEEVDTVYYFVASPFGAANRDFCQKRICRIKYPKENQNCLLYFSVENKKAPKPKGYVRCQTFLSGYIIENLPDNQGARLYFVSNNDVGGNIPKSLVNWVASRAPISWFNNLRKGCIDIHKKQQAQIKKDNDQKQVQR